MRSSLLVILPVLWVVSCGSPELDDPKTLDDIIAEAIDEDRLQKRGKEGEKLIYAPNMQTPYTGWTKVMYKNGQVKQLRHLKDGKTDGLGTSWHENGQKKALGKWKDGKLDGLGTSWHENGQKRKESNWKNNMQDGLETWWYENGQKMQESNWKNGKLDGLETRWYENGQKKAFGNWKDGKLDGLGTWWHENGQKREESNWKDDKLVTTTHWKPNGEKCSITNVLEGNGVVVVYNDDGTEAYRKSYQNGDGELIYD